MRFDQKRGNQPIPTTRRVAYPRRSQWEPPHPKALATDPERDRERRPISTQSERSVCPVWDTHTHDPRSLSLSHSHTVGCRLVTQENTRAARRRGESARAKALACELWRSSERATLIIWQSESRSRAAAAWGGNMLWRPDGEFRLTWDHGQQLFVQAGPQGQGQQLTLLRGVSTGGGISGPTNYI